MRSIRSLALGSVLFAVGCAHSAIGPAGPNGDAVTLRAGQTMQELVDRGTAFALIGDLTRGEQYLSAALERGADPRRVLPLLAHICVEAGRYRVAAEYLRQYLNADSDNVPIHLLYGSLEAAVGDREVARREYETVVRTHPDNSEGHYALAILFRDAMGDRDAMGSHFREYLRLAPGGAHAAEARASLADEAP